MKFDLLAWRTRNKLTYDQAAKKLGMGKTTFYDHSKRDVLPDWLILACKAIDAGIGVKQEER